MNKIKLLLSFFLISFLILASFPWLIVKAQDSTIYVRSNGTIEGTNKIQQEGIVFTFIDNVVDQSIIIEKDDIILDGNGYTLQGGHIWLENRYNVTVTNIHITDSTEGIRIMGNSVNNSIIGNKITNIKFETAGNAIWVYLGASNNTISKNTISNSNVGIYVYMSGSTTISENNITDNNVFGIWLIGSQNRVIRNNIINNGIGIDDKIGGNFIQHNNFVNNSVTVSEASSLTNAWDDGYPSGGNYWSNYNGTDTDGDGIGDTPYKIGDYVLDNYPFINPIDLETIPEFPSWTPFLISGLFAAFLMALVYRQRVIRKGVNEEK